MNDIFCVRPMLITDLEMAMDLAISEGWNQTEKDWRLLFDNKSNICLAAETGGKVIGTATAINYAGLESWIGMVLVDKEYRRHGIGRQLMTSIIDSLKGVRAIKLDATPAGQPVYEKLGFIEEYLLSRMICLSFAGIKSDDIPEVEPVRQEDLSDIIQFDREVFGVDRTYLISTIRNNYPHKAFLIRKGDKIDGFVLGRDGKRYNYIGPVFAHSPADAILLVSQALKSVETGSAIAIDIMGNRKELSDWLEMNGFQTQRQFTRMYLGSNPFPGKIEYQYLISGPEFG